MIRTVKIQRLGCTPGGSCCSDCQRMGDVPDSSSADLGWLALLMSVGGFLLAGVASGKFRKSGGR